MREGVPTQFNSPEEEIAYLRERLAEQERDLLERAPEADAAEVEAARKEPLKEYVSFMPTQVLTPEYELSGPDLAQSLHTVEVAADPVAEILTIAKEKGIRNALSVLERSNNAYIIDEVHRHLIEEIRQGVSISDLKEGVPPWHILHMTLYEVTVPAQQTTDGQSRSLPELIRMMEQLLAGLRTIGSAQANNHFVLEVAVANESDDIIFYVAVPNEYRALFEKQTLSIFPHAVLTEQLHDYNIFVNDGHTLVADVVLKRHPIYPLAGPEDFSADPLAVILNAFSQIERSGGGAAVQFSVRYPSHDYHKQYAGIRREVEKGVKPSEAISRSSFTGAAVATINDLLFSRKSTTEPASAQEVDTQAVELFGQKIRTQIVEVNIRVVVSATTLEQAKQTLVELESTFNQFGTTAGNTIEFRTYTGARLRQAQKAFSFRQFDIRTALPLSVTELATMIHVPGTGFDASPQFKQSHARTAPAPTEMPATGTLLGVNRHRGTERSIYVTEKDRMRHFYVIGQTGTGKSVFLKNLIMQDIHNGDGVCMIDPHGTDIEDVLAAVPPEREQDIIYLDPSRTDRVIGLNMLEYDVTKPEQKTFVVNELFSIFQKLYSANPEAMGPMFEQYFRNATMLVMEDPESGNTLMDISRVMSDARYRRHKLERAQNPVVTQFWREIATKAGGEASLENIVPYIVSKFDVFTANDYMRPIIGQQQSTFNFRQLMDERKIFLVNLSKGRLGEINANLIGMIVVGKLLMAALSRVDDPSGSFPPFYLHIDEFQNVTTNSIAAILSEARKYKLSLSMAHQFIAQLQPEIRDAVFGNVGSMATFRVGPEDASALEHQFAPTFSVSDLMNVPNFNAYLRVLANGTPTQPFSVATMPPPEVEYQRVPYLVEQSLARYGRPREEVEAEIAARYHQPAPTAPRPMPPGIR
ncbi:MAG: type IV secretory system conjugative DNA transfer family protein [Patescibacteria group bacterium]